MSVSPTSPSPGVAHARATLAAVQRHHPDDADRIATARARLRAAGAEDYVRRLVEAAPPLSVETRARLAAILLGGTS